MYNIPDGTKRGRGGGRITQSLLRHTAQRQVVRPMEFRGTARGVRGIRCCCVHVPPRGLQAAQIQEELFDSVLSDHSRPRHPETPTTHKLHLTHLSNNDWNDNHFRTGHACGSGTAQLVAAVMLHVG